MQHKEKPGQAWRDGEKLAKLSLVKINPESLKVLDEMLKQFEERTKRK